MILPFRTLIVCLLVTMAATIAHPTKREEQTAKLLGTYSRYPEFLRERKPSQEDTTQATQPTSGSTPLPPRFQLKVDAPPNKVADINVKGELSKISAQPEQKKGKEVNFSRPFRPAETAESVTAYILRDYLEQDRNDEQQQQQPSSSSTSIP